MPPPAAPPEFRTVRVWDAPTRLFHWGMVTLLMISVASAARGFDRLHVVSGYGMATLLLFRAGWGVAGSDSARFARFVRSPAAALRHLRRMGIREPDAMPGHNPAGGWMVLLMLGLLSVQVTTGVFAYADSHLHGPLSGLVGRTTRDAATAVHAANIWLIVGAAGVHLLAVTLYLVVKDQDLVGPMIGGDKRLPAGAAAPKLQGGRRALGILAGAAMVVWAVSHLG